jgi:hypothetical protein
MSETGAGTNVNAVSLSLRKVKCPMESKLRAKEVEWRAEAAHQHRIAQVDGSARHEATAETLISCADELAAVLDEERWIPVSERLPDDDVVTSVWFVDADGDVLHWWMCESLPRGALKWKPSYPPEPPKREEER